MQVLGVVLASALITSVAWAESPVLVIDNRVGWLTKFDSLSFSVSSSWEDADPKKRKSVWSEGEVSFACNEKREYSFSWVFKSTAASTSNIKMTRKKILISGGSSMTLRYLDMRVRIGLNSDPSALNTFAFTEPVRFNENAMTPDEFLSLIRDFYDSGSISIQLVDNPKIKTHLAIGVGESELHPSERSKEALSLAYSVCRSFLRR